ncbi:MAG: hypothetical protein LCH30_03400 [Proteobacteria bacterium]|nr:hypothetical protein [Pseudomonadota bacterium]
MANCIFEEHVNLKDLPTPISQENRFREITVGDMHANAMKFIYILAEIGLITNLDENTYQQLWAIYTKDPKDLTGADLDYFEEIIDNFHFSKDKTKLRLLGDLLSDRGMNDIFMLFLFEKLAREQVDFSILASNHDMNFLSWLFNPAYEPSIGKNCIRSLDNLNILIERGLIAKNEIEVLIKQFYLPHLKLVDITDSTDFDEPESDESIDSLDYLQDAEVSLYSHAPIGLETLRTLAEYYELEHAEIKCLRDLKYNINYINQEFIKRIESVNLSIGDVFDLKATLAANPEYAVFWNRDMQLERPSSFDGIDMYYIYGHNYVEEQLPHLICLDNFFGKEEDVFDSRFEDHKMMLFNPNLSIIYDDRITEVSGLIENDSDDDSIVTTKASSFVGTSPRPLPPKEPTAISDASRIGLTFFSHRDSSPREVSTTLKPH